jgi:ATP-dependent Clp protease adaptor protein ClpS
MSKYNPQVSGETQTITRERPREPHHARVILLNDDYTSMNFVVRVLMEIFHKKHSEATIIMLAVHKKGRGECGIYPKEVAETKVANVHARAKAENFPLRCEIEPV